MDPHLDINDVDMFNKLLDKTTVYFEYGSGGSTYQASIRSNIIKIYTVESDMVWVNKVKDLVKSTNIIYLINEMDTESNNWGHPGKNATDIQKISYSNQIKNLSNEDQNNIDLVFIDGRFRVACCLKCHNLINNECLIAFDDFLDRPHYHIVLDYFDIIEKTTSGRMVVLKKKLNVCVPQTLIEKYELDPR